MAQNPDGKLRCLLKWRKRVVSGRFEHDTEAVDGEHSKQKKRLDLDGLLNHYRKHGSEQTFLSTDCKHVLPDGRPALKVYVMPKYKLHFAWKFKEDMAAMMDLALASSPEDVIKACASAETHTYHIYRHMSESGFSLAWGVSMQLVSSPLSALTLMKNAERVGILSRLNGRFRENELFVETKRGLERWAQFDCTEWAHLGGHP